MTKMYFDLWIIWISKEIVMNEVNKETKTIESLWKNIIRHYGIDTSNLIGWDEEITVTPEAPHYMLDDELSDWQMENEELYLGFLQEINYEISNKDFMNMCKKYFEEINGLSESDIQPLLKVA